MTSHGAKIAGAEKGANLVGVIGAVQRMVNPEAGKPEALAGGAGQLPKIEQVRAVADGLRLSPSHLIEIYPVGVEKPRMKKLYLERKTGATPQRAARVEADRAVLVVGQLRERVGQLNVLCLVWFTCQLARDAPHRRPVERCVDIAGRLLSGNGRGRW